MAFTFDNHKNINNNNKKHISLWPLLTSGAHAFKAFMNIRKYYFLRLNMQKFLFNFKLISNYDWLVCSPVWSNENCEVNFIYMFINWLIASIMLRWEEISPDQAHCLQITCSVDEAVILGIKMLIWLQFMSEEIIVREYFNTTTKTGCYEWRLIFILVWWH